MSIKGFHLIALLAIMLNYETVGQTIYLLPGQGSDKRIFSDLVFAKEYTVKHIEYPIPLKGETMKEFASRLTNQIDTSDHFILIGVSLGGMLATELSEMISPDKVIIISSAKNRNELPGRYKFQQKLPVYKMVGPKLSKAGAKALQPLVEPDRNNNKDTFKAMLQSKDPIYLDRTIDMIMEWNRTDNNSEIIHIHGDRDHTIPIQNVVYDTLIVDGSHMMTLTRAPQISSIINTILTY